LGRSESSRVEIRGKTFTLDCTGTVLAAFYGGLGLDLARDFNRFTGNGVKRLYATLKQLNLLHRRKLPAPGDIIFWDNTWDANEDGNFRNDELTHTGLVVAVDKDGTVSYIHAHIRRGVVREVMNLALPREREDAQGKPLNSPLALASAERRKTEEPSGGLSGNLWNSFGSAVRRKDYFAAPPPP
jgi:hypothetical protein